MELAPVEKHLAASLGANLLCARYTGHGLQPMERGGEALVSEQSHMQLRRDAAVAYALASRLGTRVIILGSSTGATLALWLSSQAWVRGRHPTGSSSCAGLVLISPGFRLGAVPRLAWLVVAWLVLLLPHIATRSLLHFVNGGAMKKPQATLLPGRRGDAQVRCWTRVYPIEAVRHVIELYLLFSLTVALEDISVPVLAMGHPEDKTVSFEATRDAVKRMPRAELRVVDGAENKHIVTGQIASPATIDFVVREAAAFLERECGIPANVPAATLGEAWERSRSRSRSPARG